MKIAKAFLEVRGSRQARQHSAGGRLAGERGLREGWEGRRGAFTQSDIPRYIPGRDGHSRRSQQEVTAGGHSRRSQQEEGPRWPLRPGVRHTLSPKRRFSGFTVVDLLDTTLSRYMHP